MTKDYFTILADYNVWANEIVHSWLDALSDEQWTQNIVSSFSSLAKTALHTAGGETLWLDILNKVNEPVPLIDIMKGEKKEVQDAWKKSSAGLKLFIENFDEHKLKDVLKYKRVADGKFYELEYFQIFAHVVNHSTYHRGQIVTMLRQVGFTNVRSIDMSTYFWNKKN